MKCNSCGAEIDSSARKCNYCSAPLQTQILSETETKEFQCSHQPLETDSQIQEVKNSRFLPTFWLCLFLGGFGAHRLYNGLIKSGIFMLLLSIVGNFRIVSGPLQSLASVGVLIWILVDLSHILSGKFKGKDGVMMPNTRPRLTWTVTLILILGGVGLVLIPEILKVL